MGCIYPNCVSVVVKGKEICTEKKVFPQAVLFLIRTTRILEEIVENERVLYLKMVVRQSSRGK